MEEAKKKNEDLGESESTISECDDSGTWEERSVELAESLGAEFVELSVLDEQGLLPFLFKTASRVAPKLNLGKTLGGPLVRQGTAAITKVKPTTTAITRVQPATTAITKVKPTTSQPVPQVQVRNVTKNTNSVKVDLDTKTGQITKADPKVKTQTLTQIKDKTKTKTKDKTKTKIPDIETDIKPDTETDIETKDDKKPPVLPPPPRKPPVVPPIPPKGTGFPIPLPKFGITIGEPRNVGKVVRV